MPVGSLHHSALTPILTHIVRGSRRRLSPEDRERGPEITRQLRAALGQALAVNFTTFSDRHEGFADDGLPAWQDVLGVIETREGLVTLLLQRVPREEDGGADRLRSFIPTRHRLLFNIGRDNPLVERQLLLVVIVGLFQAGGIAPDLR